MKLIINIGLYVFAALLCIGLAPLALIHTIVDQLRYGSRLSSSFRQGAYALDVYANVTYSSFLDGWFLKKGGYHFGYPNETISSALGKNLTLDKLTTIGEGCAGFLNLIDPDHCYNAIQGNWLIANKPTVVWWKILFFLIL